MSKLFRLVAIAAITTLYSSQSQAQTLQGLWDKVKENAGKTSGTGTNGLSLNNISNTDIVSALKEALNVGTKNAAGRLSVQNGYFGNALVKILMPPEAVKVENALRQIGMSSLVDKTILSMNRAAEDAANKAVPIFINAITSMSITDGINIVRGGNGAATSYLKARTTAQLTSAFRPVIKTSLNKINADTYWTQVFTTYNRLPMTFNKVNPDLTAYVTERALDGLFKTIADEENKIRLDPAARVTDLLKKVFGAK